MRWLLLLVLAACGSDPEIPPVMPADDTAEPSPPPPPPDPVSESFVYYPPRLDLVFVVDEDDWQLDLAPALDGFVAGLEERDIDYHVGVTSIYRQDDGTAGVLVALGPMRWGEPAHDGAAGFLRGAMLTITDNGDQCGTLAARDVIEHAAPDGPNEGFFRADAELAFLVVSDESDRSHAYGFDHTAFVEYLRAQRDDERDVAFHAITRPHDQVGQQYYLGVVNGLNGCIHSLDAPPFEPALTCVLDSVEPTNVFPLAGDPDPDTLTVVVDEPGLGEVELTSDQFAWDEAAHAVRLVGYHPRYSADVEIGYIAR